MPLPTNGRLTLSMIAAEFGVNPPYKLSDFYGMTGLPAEGPLKMSAFYGVSAGPDWAEQTQLVASDKERADYFGRSCSISSDGSTVLVGAYREDPDGASDAGAAYIFTRQNGVWSEQAKLVASDKEASDNFGVSCSISGDGTTVIVGAQEEDLDGASDVGAAYIFTRQNGVWSEQAKLEARDKEVYDNFGISCSISGDGTTAIVGAHEEDPDGLRSAGAAYIFTRQNGVWSEQAKLVASDKKRSDRFGYSCSISGDGSTVLVGAFGVARDGALLVGAAYTFTQQNGVWSEQAKLVGSDKGSFDLFGYSCSISGDGSTVLVGAYGVDPDGTSDAGTAYIFQNGGAV